MKSYPSISKQPILNQPVYAFDKLDGSNIRAEWSKKQGFYKFGSRKRLLDESDPLLGTAKQLFLNKYERDLTEIFNRHRWERVVVFFEYYSLNSFAGNHADEPHDVIIFDVDLYKKGLLGPKEFIKIFQTVETPKLLYYGNMNFDFAMSVMNRSLPGMTFEGVVCKAQIGSIIKMSKIKSQDWLTKLKGICGDDTKLYETLE